jgi:hypothetical protein
MWGTRKGFKVGPFRFTVSGSGLTTSFGGKHGRVSRSSRGRSRVTIRPFKGASYTRSRGR